MKCCASSHEPPDTACRLFEAGQNGRCAYCDHEEKCHPGPGTTCEIGNAAKHALILNRNAAITVSETNIDRVTKCPQCGDAVVQTNLGGGKTDDYCEECGWPDEDRREKIDILVQWMAERLNILRNQQPTPVAWAGDRRLGKIAELEFVIRTANDIRGCIYPGEPCCGRPKKECTCAKGPIEAAAKLSEAKLPWAEKVAMLSINPDAASSADVAQLASELANCHQQDRLKTNEINVLVKENNELRAALREVLNRAIPHNSDFLVTRYAINKVCAVLGTKAPTGIGHHGGVE